MGNNLSEEQNGKKERLSHFAYDETSLRLEKLGQKLFIVAIVVVISAISTLITFDIFILDTWEERGTFGDTFGFLNAIFSGLAFGGIIYTILLQQHELKKQRLELEFTRKEIEGQREQLTLQKIEYHFFNLLKLRNELVQSMYDREKSLEGLDIIETALFEFRDEYNKAKLLATDNNPPEAEEYFIIMYDRYCENLDPYYRNLLHIIEFIDKSEEIKENDKHQYIDALKAQFSTSEVALLAYYGMYVVENQEDMELLEKYYLLENIILNPLLDEAAVIIEHYIHLKKLLKVKKGINKFSR